MITKEELKKEIDRMPDHLLDRVYLVLRRMFSQKGNEKMTRSSESVWEKWNQSLDKFTPDFMEDRNQPPQQLRDSFD